MREILLSVLAISVAWTGGWKKLPTVQDEYASSNFVAVATVVSARDVRDESGTLGTYYTLKISHLIKGTDNASCELYSENSSGRFPMQIGTSYLIFATTQVFEGISKPCLAIDSSGNSTEAINASVSLGIIRGLKQGQLNNYSQPSAIGGS